VMSTPKEAATPRRRAGATSLKKEAGLSGAPPGRIARLKPKVIMGATAVVEAVLVAADHADAAAVEETLPSEVMRALVECVAVAWADSDTAQLIEGAVETVAGTAVPLG
jgi:hypothetical protein